MGSHTIEISVTLNLGAEHQWTSDPQVELLGRTKNNSTGRGKLGKLSIYLILKGESLKTPCTQRFISAIINFHSPSNGSDLSFSFFDQ